jgi:hypothetical protein
MRYLLTFVILFFVSYGFAESYEECLARVSAADIIVGTPTWETHFDMMTVQGTLTNNTESIQENYIVMIDFLDASSELIKSVDSEIEFGRVYPCGTGFYLTMTPDDPRIKSFEVYVTDAQGNYKTGVDFKSSRCS